MLIEHFERIVDQKPVGCKKVNLETGQWVISLVDKALEISAPPTIISYSGGNIYQYQEEYIVIGVEAAAVKMYLVGLFDSLKRLQATELLLVASQPFGLITTRYSPDGCSRNGFEVSRQIYENEIQLTPPFAHPQSLRDEEGGEWLRLVDLANRVKMTPEEFWQNFVVVFSNCGDWLADKLKTFRIADPNEQSVKSSHPCLFRVVSERAPDKLTVDKVYLPLGWAKTCLYLLGFGYDPNSQRSTSTNN